MSYGTTSKRQIYVYLESPKEEERDKIKYLKIYRPKVIQI